MDRIKSIDYANFTDSVAPNVTGFIGLINNTNNNIPNDYIKNLYFTNVKNKDGLLLQWDKAKSHAYDNETKNAIIFNYCDKAQTVTSHIELILINGVKLKTAHERKVIVE